MGFRKGKHMKMIKTLVHYTVCFVVGATMGTIIAFVVLMALEVTK